MSELTELKQKYSCKVPKMVLVTIKWSNQNLSGGTNQGAEKHLRNSCCTCYWRQKKIKFRWPSAYKGVAFPLVYLGQYLKPETHSPTKKSYKWWFSWYWGTLLNSPRSWGVLWRCNGGSVQCRKLSLGLGTPGFVPLTCLFLDR